MHIKCIDSWQAQLTEGKYYKVLAMHNQYFLIVDDMGRECWEYCKNFTEIPENISYAHKKVNWDIL